MYKSYRIRHHIQDMRYKTSYTRHEVQDIGQHVLPNRGGGLCIDIMVLGMV